MPGQELRRLIDAPGGGIENALDGCCADQDRVAHMLQPHHAAADDAKFELRFAEGRDKSIFVIEVCEGSALFECTTLGDSTSHSLAHSNS